VYAAALAPGHEGVLAKHLTSSYQPGQLSRVAEDQALAAEELFSARNSSY
jgi:hypothetical protein